MELLARPLSEAGDRGGPSRGRCGKNGMGSWNESTGRSRENRLSGWRTTLAVVSVRFESVMPNQIATALASARPAST